MQTSQAASQNSNAPRWIENIHILLWLIKDTCWALFWRPGGIIMIIPTVGVAIYLLYRSRHNRIDFFHNASVCMWICANATWMIGEFINRDYRPVAVVFFSIGLVILLVYYAFYFAKDRRDGIGNSVV